MPTSLIIVDDFLGPADAQGLREAVGICAEQAVCSKAMATQASQRFAPYGC